MNTLRSFGKLCVAAVLAAAVAGCVYEPAPYYAAPAPSYYAPAPYYGPSVSLGVYGGGGGHRHHHRHHRHW